MASAYHTQRRVEFHHTDMAGIMHFSRFFLMMEEVEHEFLRSRGLSVHMPYRGKKLGFPRVSAGCDFKSPAYFEEVLDITLQVERIGRRSITYAIEFSRAGEAIASGKLSACCCEHVAPDKIVPIDVPDDLRLKLLAEPTLSRTEI
jgi:4-hydroxybenzoyl-CoA thioesterase/acyl-CoA thioester hydrolase